MNENVAIKLEVKLNARYGIFIEKHDMEFIFLYALQTCG